MGGKPSPFGMDVELLRRAAPDRCSPHGAVRLRGLHAHLASGLGADGLLAAARRLVAFGREWCAAHGVTEPEFNLGGGMAVDYTRPGRAVRLGGLRAGAGPRWPAPGRRCGSSRAARSPPTAAGT